MNLDLEAATAALLALTEHGISPDVQELLVNGDEGRAVAPGALSNAIKAALMAYGEQLKLVAWAAYRELNEIRARDGVPYTHQGFKATIDEAYFSNVVDALASVLGDDAKPWPAKRWCGPDGSFVLPGQNPALLEDQR